MDNIEALLKEKGLTKTDFFLIYWVSKNKILNGLMKNPNIGNY
mgnify:CR=1 FL=1